MTAPAEFSWNETLRDGRGVTIRTLRASDRERVAAAVRGLGRESIYTRLFSHRKELTEAGLTRIMTVDSERDVAVLVTIGSGADEIAIGSGRYVSADAGDGERTAEVAFVVEEDYQGLGIAGRVLKHLVDIARDRGITAFEADVLEENKSMLAVFARCGLPMQRRRDGGVVHVTLSLAPDA
jgi:RimJ/RimL family protein N-acetyltransferase